MQLNLSSRFVCSMVSKSSSGIIAFEIAILLKYYCYIIYIYIFNKTKITVFMEISSPCWPANLFIIFLLVTNFVQWQAQPVNKNCTAFDIIFFLSIFFSKSLEVKWSFFHDEKMIPFLRIIIIIAFSKAKNCCMSLIVRSARCVTTTTEIII